RGEAPPRLADRAPGADQLMALATKPRQARRADQAVGSGDQDAHAVRGCSMRALLPGARPADAVEHDPLVAHARLVGDRAAHPDDAIEHARPRVDAGDGV